MNKIYTTLLSLLLLIPLSSCLTDTPWENGEYGLRAEDLETKKILEVKGLSTNRVLSVLTDEPVKEVQLFTVHLAAKDVAQEDIVVKIKAVTPAKNALAQSEIEVPATVTIKKGERDAPVVAKVKTGTLTSDAKAVKIQIDGANQGGYTVSGNFGAVTLNLLERSAYEGRYKYEILENKAWPDYSVYIAQGAEDYVLETVSKYTVVGYLLYGVFNDRAQFSFDPETHAVSKVEVVGWTEFPLVESTYDAAAKVWQFKVHHPSSAARTLVYKLTRLD